MFRVTPAKLFDCQRHGPGSGAELFIVEGDSASKNVLRVRDQKFQAVLPMQGKPLNAWKANKSSVGGNELFQKLIDAIGTGWGDSYESERLRYERIVLLFDPDADGIHCGALMVMFFYRWMPDLLGNDRIVAVRPPLYELTAQRRAEKDVDRIHAYSDEHFQRLRVHLEARNVRFNSQRFRGLASINADALSETCVDPATRNTMIMGVEDAKAAVRVFVGGKM